MASIFESFADKCCNSTNTINYDLDIIISDIAFFTKMMIKHYNLFGLGGPLCSNAETIFTNGVDNADPSQSFRVDHFGVDDLVELSM